MFWPNLISATEFTISLFMVNKLYLLSMYKTYKTDRSSTTTGSKVVPRTRRDEKGMTESHFLIEDSFLHPRP